MGSAHPAGHPTPADCGLYLQRTPGRHRQQLLRPFHGSVARRPGAGRGGRGRDPAPVDRARLQPMRLQDHADRWSEAASGEFPATSGNNSPNCPAIRPPLEINASLSGGPPRRSSTAASSVLALPGRRTAVGGPEGVGRCGEAMNSHPTYARVNHYRRSVDLWRHPLLTDYAFAHMVLGCQRLDHSD